MSRWLTLARSARLLIPSAAVLQLSGCLSDAQLSEIMASVISTGLITLVTQAIGTLGPGAL
jgi:hypothetical protein